MLSGAALTMHGVSLLYYYYYLQYNFTNSPLPIYFYLIV